MKYKSLKFNYINPDSFKHRRAEQSDCSIFINESTTITLQDQNDPCLIYIKDVEVDGLLDACSKIYIPTNVRGRGLVTTSRTFGYAPRNLVRNLGCRNSSLNIDSPEEHNSIVKCADRASFYYNRYANKVAKRHQSMTDNYLDSEYKLGESMFTSGVINKDNPLLYHYDKGNYTGVWSAMFAFKKDVEGGYLAIPELDIMLETSDRSLTLFNGQLYLHGVTPVVKKSKSAYRYTVVYYSLKDMWNCEPYKGEVEYLRQKRTYTEQKKAERGNRVD